MKIKKSLISLLFILITIIIVPNVVNATVGDKFTVDGIEYTVQTEDTVIVSGYEGDITSVTIEESVTDGTNTYNVISIGDSAFKECNKLTDIEILGNSVKSIGDNAFWNCDSLISVELPDSVVSIGANAFTLCEVLMDMKIPESVTTIGESAFCYCRTLKNITIPSSITSIGARAFEECDTITSVNIPDTIASIPDRMLYACDSLENVTIPNSITSIGDAAFGMCRSLKDITIPNTVKSIGESAFAFDGLLTKIVIPEGVTSIEAGTFFDCPSLKEVELPDSLTTIKMNAFWGCTSLTEITIPHSVTSIGDDAFGNCTSLKIYAQNESIAKEYAEQNDIDFEALYKIVINKAEGATITPKDSIVDLAKGSDVDIEIKADKGYKIVAVKVNGVEQTLSGNLLTIKNITDDKNIVVETKLESHNNNTSGGAMGEESSDSIDNPQTGDNVIAYIGILVISILGIAVVTKFRKNLK